MATERNRIKPNPVVVPFRRRSVISRLRSRISELELAHKEANAARDALMVATKALRESEERYALAMRGPGEGLWDWDPVTKELFLSTRLLSILGFDSETVRTTSHDWLKMVHPDDRDDYQSTLIHHLKGETDHFECEYRVRTRNGEYRWIRSRGLAVRGANGVATRMVGSLGDITESKRREAILRASEARFRSLIEVAASIIVVVGFDGRVQQFNREAERILGVSAAAVIGKPWRDVLGESVGALFEQWLEQAGAGQQLRDREGVLGSRVVSWNLAPLDTEDGIVIVGQDITERRRAETALRQANDLLEYRVAARTEEAEAARRLAEEANRCKSEFLANMSHELRTPLNAIIGFSDVMRLGVLGPVGNASYAEYVQSIWDSGNHLLSIINDVLDLSKVEAGHFDLAPEPLPLVPLVEQVIRLLQEKAMRQRLELRLAVVSDPGRALVDPLRMKQVLLNLVGNSLKFTPAGGSVQLALGRDAQGVWITVADSGIGMNPGDIQRVLEPFVQVDDQATRRQSGTGLGLPIAKKFIELHGGSFAMDSAPGQGTKVTIRLSSAATDC